MIFFYYFELFCIKRLCVVRNKTKRNMPLPTQCLNWGEFVQVPDSDIVFDASVFYGPPDEYWRHDPWAPRSVQYDDHITSVPMPELQEYVAQISRAHALDIVRNQPIAYRPNRRPSPMIAHQQPSVSERNYLERATF